MGCSYSTPNDQMQTFNRPEFSIELSIAKRPGGPDVGPIHANDRSSDGSTPSELELEEETAPKAVIKTKKLPVGVIIFYVVKVVANEDGVMFYHFCGTSAKEPTKRVRLAKRYSDFKSLHAEMAELMASERNVPAAQQHLFETHPALPEMPKSNAWTYFRGRYNETVLEEREDQFTRILNAISRHPVAYKSKPFTRFLLA
ncbi:hypothetical protein F441_00735 [Phytophthora nicotianae CJ01A1]|uniref:ABC transporter A family member 1 n=3 Tax=Phytophthora nicotianae TaxID=4792 RepID=W2M006_PHYNI|nr:hypothetical protein L915_00695 [Phytophthora nicotianae]ETO85598.1 hypothetical protein F444_00749 [Phytophthora nicotianae P1976]ETP26643.1 hypothetical protein F441_00735 [Phytophthora nicotianae CJ01A1]KUF80859.1 hypothetical protein AM587_10013987 [Phytophthora nicotianae]ETL50000.1 hypothetical protein L916_00690 [Phytophthora nicotianae]